MGFRYRKTFKAGPFRATVSKTGISYSAGVKGARVTKLANGKVQKTVSIPGSGLSYTSTSGSTKKQQQAKSQTARPAQVKASKPARAAKPTKVKAPKPVKVKAPKPVKVKAPKPVKVKAPKPVEPAKQVRAVAQQGSRPAKPSSARGGARSTIAAVPMWIPGRNRGYLGSVTLNQADVVIERSILGRVVGFRAVSIPWGEIVTVNFRDPTLARNGFVHFVIQNDQRPLSAPGNYNKLAAQTSRPNLVMFTWQQRRRYQRLKGILSGAARS